MSWLPWLRRPLSPRFLSDALEHVNAARAQCDPLVAPIDDAELSFYPEPALTAVLRGL